MTGLVVGVIASICCWLISKLLPENIFGLLLLILINAMTLSMVIYIVGLNHAERVVFQNIIHKILNKNIK